MDLVTFTEEILNRKLHFLYSDCSGIFIACFEHSSLYRCDPVVTTGLLYFTDLGLVKVRLKAMNYLPKEFVCQCFRGS